MNQLDAGKFIRSITGKMLLEIEKYAKEKNISFDEAAEKAYITINGQKIEPIKNPEFSYEPKL